MTRTRPIAPGIVRVSVIVAGRTTGGGSAGRFVNAHVQRPMNRFFLIYAYLLAGAYWTFGRLFSYFGVPPFYPAEVFLLSFVAVRPGHAVGSVFDWLRHHQFTVLFFLLFVLWGLFCALRGAIDDARPELYVRGFAAHYYAFLFFVGIRLSFSTDTKELATSLYVVALAQAVYGIASNVFLDDAPITVPWGPELTLGDGHLLYPYSAVALLTLAPLVGRPVMAPLALVVVAVVLQAQRAFMVSLVLGIFLCLILQRRIVLLRKLLAVGVALIAVSSVAVGVFSDDGTVHRALAFPWLVARLIEPFSPQLAVSLLVDSGYNDAASVIYGRHGTIDWRWQFWGLVMQSLDTAALWLFGHGYGFSLGSLFVGEEVRTPHNIAVYFLGYTGLVGVVLYAGFMMSMARDFLILPPSPLRVFLICQFVVVLSFAAFSNALETPHFAVPFYLVSGIAYGLAWRDANARAPARSRVIVG